MPSLLPPCPPISLRALLVPSVPSLFHPCPPCSLHAPLHVCARMSVSLMLSAGKARSWALSGLPIVLKELLSPNKPGKVPAGSVCSSPPLLPPARVSSVTVAGRLQHEGHIQLPAAFPSQLRSWDPGQWHHQVHGMAGQGFIGSGHCRVAVHGTPALLRETPWKSRSMISLGPYSLPCVHARGNVDGITGEGCIHGPALNPLASAGLAERAGSMDANGSHSVWTSLWHPWHTPATALHPLLSRQRLARVPKP